MKAEFIRPDFGSKVFARWRAEAGDDWRAYTQHAFVEGLRAGTLPRAAFLHYLAQDYLFLIHFSRAWAFAVVKAGSLAEMRHAASTVDRLINHEMDLHVRTCREAGIAEEQLFSGREEVENLAYTRFVLDGGLSGDFLDLITGLAPCVLGYAEIGARLAATAAPNNPYADWIATYAGEPYQETCRAVGALLDSATAARLGAEPERNPRWEALSRRFSTAVRLEVGFWDMGLRAGA